MIIASPEADSCHGTCRTSSDSIVLHPPAEASSAMSHDKNTEANLEVVARQRLEVEDSDKAKGRQSYASRG